MIFPERAWAGPDPAGETGLLYLKPAAKIHPGTMMPEGRAFASMSSSSPRAKRLWLFPARRGLPGNSAMIRPRLTARLRLEYFARAVSTRQQLQELTGWPGLRNRLERHPGD